METHSLMQFNQTHNLALLRMKNKRDQSRNNKVPNTQKVALYQWSTSTTPIKKKMLFTNMSLGLAKLKH